MIQKLIPLLLASTTLACVAEDACPPYHMPEKGACVLDEAAVADQMRRFDDGDLERVNDQEFQQVLGERTARNVYMNRLPAGGGLDTIELYRHVDPRQTTDGLPRPFPVGTLIVHERVDRIEGSTVQVRLSDDYRSEGDSPWWFGKYFEDGTPDDVPCSPCAMCHNASLGGDTEGLQGVPVEAWGAVDGTPAPDGRTP